MSDAAKAEAERQRPVKLGDTGSIPWQLGFVAGVRWAARVAGCPDEGLRKEDVIERVAEAIHNSNRRQHTAPKLWHQLNEDRKEGYRVNARAALGAVAASLPADAERRDGLTTEQVKRLVALGYCGCDRSCHSLDPRRAKCRYRNNQVRSIRELNKAASDLVGEG